MTDFLVIEKNHFGAIFRVENTFTKIFFAYFFTLGQSRGHTIANFDIFDEGIQTPGAVHLDLNSHLGFHQNIICSSHLILILITIYINLN